MAAVGIATLSRATRSDYGAGRTGLMRLAQARGDMPYNSRGAVGGRRRSLNSLGNQPVRI
jgi:hypothetical protein